MAPVEGQVVLALRVADVVPEERVRTLAADEELHDLVHQQRTCRGLGHEQRVHQPGAHVPAGIRGEEQIGRGGGRDHDVDHGGQGVGGPFPAVPDERAADVGVDRRWCAPATAPGQEPGLEDGDEHHGEPHRGGDRGVDRQVVER